MTLSDGIIYKTNMREIKNILGILLIAFMIVEMTEEKYKKFINIYSQIVAVVLTFSAFISAYSFFSVLTGRNLGLMGITRGKKFIGIGLSGSYNMFALGMFAGLLAVCHCFSKAKSTVAKTLYLISIGIMIIVIALAGSRRGWIVLFLLISYYLVKICILNLKTITRHIRRIRVNTIRVFVSILLVFVLSSSVFFLSKNKIRIVKPHQLRRITFRFNTIFSREGDFEAAFSKRTMRWHYAGYVLDGYNVWKLLLGGGFDYINEYGLQFNSATFEGNPHNIFISAMFYSGIVGLGLLIAMVGLGGMRLLERRKLFGEQFILLFIVCLVFVTLGAHSLFSVRLLPLILLTIFSVRGSESKDYSAL
jgi:hypothetical protein